ncbi:pentapeptide repeat-containing protein [Marinomonas mediterranea]|jgi:Uncharacterized low-complexity proteins|uniref:Pentapeptide repeat protein n=1 Tax=Marinomonas mediterranea (strain ATCC 700492 / JCM 21426 / NBRC 103028 / MMB-1) TaxID=717774 RepID=F2JW12_MARM1|nr:pentapeptide repeat-containing protein [Marinomonas mediterranea]ADZ92900.1 pentapeptide repeat protein [Marinomonas mediterranea MMB-1]WCN18922.1 hypothetical protein GV053_18685 [Marinomonas mediterranea MMB-1]
MPRYTKEHPFLKRRQEQLAPTKVQKVCITEEEPEKGKLHRFADWLDSWHFTRIFQALSSFLLIVTLVGIIFDYQDRQRNIEALKLARDDMKLSKESAEQGRKVAAWQLLTTKAPGNSGKKEALEYLNNINEPLTGIDLSVEEDQQGAYLRGVELQKAKLRGSDLSHANLMYADLSEANLYRANLSGAGLSRANLPGADLSFANLSGAALFGADLSGASFMVANLSGAYLSKADLTGANLSGARFMAANFSGAYLSEADLIGANLSKANLLLARLFEVKLGSEVVSDENVDQLCSNLKKAKNWYLTYRDKELACGKPILDLMKSTQNRRAAVNLLNGETPAFHFLPETIN